MKTTLSIIALISLAAPAAAALVEIAGFAVPRVFSLESGVSVFAASFVLLLFGADYGRAAGRYQVRSVTPVLLPATGAFRSGGSRSPLGKRRSVRSSRTFYPTVIL